MNLEECLRDIRGKAALLRCVATSTLWTDQTPSHDVRNGIDTCCEEIAALAAGIGRTLSVRVLDSEVTPPDSDE
jgi:hypothetical protein